CIGNSLTEGFPFYSPFDSQGNPKGAYPFYLLELLHQSSLKHANQISVINAGIAGDTIHGIGERLSHLLLSHRPMITILLGGTNDIAIGYQPKNIIRTLKDLWDTIKVNKSQPVSCTLPPTSFNDLNQTIIWLNDLIIDASSVKDILNVDFYTPLLSDGILNSDFDSGDGTHLNKTGYQEMARTVFKTLYPEIERYIKKNSKSET
ncbi:MAG: SGNH/GDSL hydrolase family protein, partial [Candidatus Hermodarchaeota archaeon]